MRDLLVIGGSGFVGRAVVRALQRRGFLVTVLNRGNHPLEDVQQLVADRNDPHSLLDAITGRVFDAVIDTNCYTPTQASLLLDAVKTATRRMVMISSASVYSERLARPSRETDSTGGASAWGDYGKQKSLAEDVYAQAGANFDQISIIRPPYIFGQNNNLDREKWFWARQRAGLPVVLPGDGQTQIQFVYEDDLADAIYFVLARNDAGFKIFNVADPEVLTLSGLVSLLASVAAENTRQICVGERHPNVSARSWFPFRDYPCLADPTKLYSLGWRPAADLRTRFAETYGALSKESFDFQLSNCERMLIEAEC